MAIKLGGGNPDGQFVLNDNGTEFVDPFISQTVGSLNVGTTYALSWDLALHVNFGNTGGTGTSFGVFLDGSPLLLTEFLDTGWQSNNVNFIATNTSHNIGFAAELDARTTGVSQRTDVSYRIDNVSLNAVPIPGAVWLLGSGLIGLFGLRRKLKK